MVEKVLPTAGPTAVEGQAAVEGLAVAKEVLLAAGPTAVKQSPGSVAVAKRN